MRGGGAPRPFTYAAMFPILLASSSPRRRQLLEQVGFCVSTHPVDVDETPEQDEPPVAMARRLAMAKAVAAMGTAPTTPKIGISADTVVWDDRGALGKPQDDADAERMIGALSGRTHHVTTAYAVFDTRASEVVAEGVATTDVTFRELDAHEVRSYVRTGEGTDKAGAYGIQGLGAVLVRHVRGSYSNVVGLPVGDVVATLRGIGTLHGFPWEEADERR